MARTDRRVRSSSDVVTGGAPRSWRRTTRRPVGDAVHPYPRRRWATLDVILPADHNLESARVARRRRHISPRRDVDVTNKSNEQDPGCRLRRRPTLHRTEVVRRPALITTYTELDRHRAALRFVSALAVTPRAVPTAAATIGRPAPRTTSHRTPTVTTSSAGKPPSRAQPPGEICPAEPASWWNPATVRHLAHAGNAGWPPCEMPARLRTTTAPEPSRPDRPTLIRGRSRGLP